MPEFIECSSLSMSYDILGLVTVSYTLVSSSPNPTPLTSISAGGVTFRGYVTNLNMQPIANTSWYEAQVTLIATTN